MNYKRNVQNIGNIYDHGIKFWKHW